MTDDRLIDQLVTSANTWLDALKETNPDPRVYKLARAAMHIATEWPEYARHANEFTQRGLPSDSMPEHVSGTKNYTPAEIDAHDKHWLQDWQTARATLRGLITGAEGVVRIIDGTNNTHKPMPDPDPQFCANPHCPDQKWWTMIGTDHPRYLDGRCDNCHMFWYNHQRERVTIGREKARMARIKEAS